MNRCHNCVDFKPLTLGPIRWFDGNIRGDLIVYKCCHCGAHYIFVDGLPHQIWLCNYCENPPTILDISRFSDDDLRRTVQATCQSDPQHQTLIQSCLEQVEYSGWPSSPM